VPPSGWLLAVLSWPTLCAALVCSCSIFSVCCDSSASILLLISRDLRGLLSGDLLFLLIERLESTRAAGRRPCWTRTFFCSSGDLLVSRRRVRIAAC